MTADEREQAVYTWFDAKLSCLSNGLDNQRVNGRTVKSTNEIEIALVVAAAPSRPPLDDDGHWFGNSECSLNPISHRYPKYFEPRTVGRKHCSHSFIGEQATQQRVRHDHMR